MSKTYVNSSAEMDFTLTGGFSDDKNFECSISCSVPVTDGELDGSTEVSVDIVNNTTLIPENELKDIIEIALESNLSFESISEGSNWIATGDADEDVNGYVVSFNFDIPNFEIDLDEDELSEAIKLFKKNKNKKKLSKPNKKNSQKI